MLDKVKVGQAMESGLAAICAWCEHYWEATDQKPDGHSGCVLKDCGGPLLHRAFPRYKGPWSPKEKFCFICGKHADAAAEIGRTGMVGVCNEHMEKLKSLLTSRKPVTIRERVVPLIGGGETAEGVAKD